jgi:SAM-dependent methyltransferase
MGSGGVSHLFGEYYYNHNCGDSAYERSDAWLASFDQIAQRLIDDFHPGSVLDAGCAKGMLVERLRARGVEAFGIDISEYAISQVKPDIKEYCWVGSISDPLPRSYDLIISIEVVEHMAKDEANRAIENLCRFTNNIILSSSPIDFKEATHFNVHDPDYWARQFARFSFYHDLDYDASYITPWAMRFFRLDGSVQPVIQAYERRLWQLSREITDLRASVVEHHEQLQALEARQKYLADLEKTQSWKLVHKLQFLRSKMLPEGSLIDRLLRH